jgi:signal transduction histidine kinase
VPLGAALLGTSLLLVARVVLSAKEIARLQKEERAAAERLQRAKMEAIGLLAGGIAHEFNNLMATVISTASLGAEEAEPDGPAREDFGTIRLAGERAAGLTRQLLHFSGRQADRRRPLDVSQAVARMEDRLRAAAGPRTRLELSIEPAPRAHADPAQIEMALVQLARNAGQAMPSGGTLRIRVGGKSLDGPQVGAVLSAPPGRYVALEVSDTGAGIPSEVLPRIFEPFFSTRSIFESKGLGLAEVHGIVAAHAGGLAVESAPGKGTSFVLLLPAAADQPPPARPDRSGGGHA